MTVYLRLLAIVALCIGEEFVSILACGPIQRTTPRPRIHDRNPEIPTESRLDAVIRNAYKSINGSKISLVFPPANAGPPGDSSATAVKPVVKRPDVGQTAVFVCDTSRENASSALTWTHQGRPVVQNGHLLDHQYDIFYRGQVAMLSIMNVSFASSGEVTCYETSNATTTVLKRYSLHPNVYRAADVFTVPMPNWSIEKGSNEAFWCQVRFTLPPQMIKKASQLRLWRYNNRTVVAPDQPPYKLGPLTFPNKAMYVTNGNMYGSSTLNFWMKLAALDVDDSGLVECWFRASPDVDEWFVQSTAFSVHR